MDRENRVEVSRFDTRATEAPEQFALWRESIGVLFDVNAGDAGANGYSARLDSAMAGEAMVSRVQAGSQAFDRSMLRSYRDGIEGIMFQVFTRGTTRHSNEAAPIVSEGSLIGFDLTRASETINTDFDLVSIIFPRAAIIDRLGYVPDLHLSAVGGDSALSRMTAEFIVSLQRSISEMDVSEAEAASDAIADLIAEAYRGETRRSNTAAGHRLGVITCARNFIRERISAGEPVNVASVAAKLDCSRATLYRVFEPVGGVASFIRSERLRACLADMRRVASGHSTLTLGELGMRRGFESDAQFSRAFKAEFGMTPSEAKKALMCAPAADQDAGSEGADRRYEIWLRAIGAA